MHQIAFLEPLQAQDLGIDHFGRSCQNQVGKDLPRRRREGA